MQSVYILSCETPEKGGGVYRYSLSDNRLQKEDYYPCDRPMYAALEGNRLFVLLRQPFDGNERGGCFSVDLGLKNATAVRATDGVVPCHLCVDGDCYIANYVSGNLVKLGKKSVRHEGKGVNPARQSQAHTHQALLSPDKKYVLCCDLGVDTLFCYDGELNLVSKAKIADGYGLRHAVFSNDGNYIYALSELRPALHIFSFEGGIVALKGKVEIPCEKENADGAAIRLSKDGKKLYVSLRQENALVVAAVEGEKIKLLQKTDCGGDGPRDFDITEHQLIVANQKSNGVTVYALNEDGAIGEKLTESQIATPLCVVLPKNYERKHITMTGEKMNGSKNEYISHALAIIDEGFADADFKREKLAEGINLEINYLSVLFKKEVGCTIGEYLQQKRIKTAKTLLKETNLSVKEIAAKVGYADAAYFARRFKKETDLTPSDYRK